MSFHYGKEWGHYDNDGFFRPETPERVKNNLKKLSNFQIVGQPALVRFSIRKSKYGVHVSSEMCYNGFTFFVMNFD